MICKHIVVKGIVQNVGFRDAAFRHSKTIDGLQGWVRNLENGDVEILVQGKEAQVQAFEDWCHVGPPSARIDSVTVRKVMTEPTLRSFGIRRM